MMLQKTNCFLKAVVVETDAQVGVEAEIVAAQTVVKVNLFQVLQK